MSLNLLVTNDYLISPAVCLESDIEVKVESLIRLKKYLEDGNCEVYFEACALENLIEINMYPCKAIFDKNISSFNSEQVYSGADIARVVNNILSKLESRDIFIPECIAEWGFKIIEPEIDGAHYRRKKQLELVIEQACISKNITNKNFSLLHYPLKNNQKSIKLEGVILNFLPEIDKDFPLVCDEEMKVFSDLVDFICEKEGVDAFNSAVSDDEIKNALEIGVLKKIKEMGLLSGVKFSFGEHFFKSLRSHQCAPGERFANTTYEVICNILAGEDKYEVTPFYTDLNSKKQIVKDGKEGWRTHITKGNPALRLMFWRGVDELVLANVGNKKELLIL